MFTQTRFHGLLITEIAAKNGYRTVNFSARNIWLNDFKDIYFEILRQCDLMECLQGCCRKVVDISVIPFSLCSDKNESFHRSKFWLFSENRTEKPRIFREKDCEKFQIAFRNNFCYSEDTHLK